MFMEQSKLIKFNTVLYSQTLQTKYNYHSKRDASSRPVFTQMSIATLSGQLLNCSLPFVPNLACLYAGFMKSYLFLEMITLYRDRRDMIYGLFTRETM